MEYLAARREVLAEGINAMGKEEAGAGGAGGSGKRGYVPTLRRSEGLDALPVWQQQTVLIEGTRS
jgi:hypothetical protein